MRKANPEPKSYQYSAVITPKTIPAGAPGMREANPSRMHIKPCCVHFMELNKNIKNRAQEVEERLAALGKGEGQSPKSNPVGNSADLNSNENYFPGKPGAQSVAPSPSKLNKKLNSANDLDVFLKTDFNTVVKGRHAQNDITKNLLARSSRPGLIPAPSKETIVLKEHQDRHLSGPS